MKTKITLLLALVLSVGAQAMESNYNQEYKNIAKSFFPNIHESVSHCAINWNDIPKGDREIMENNYLAHAKKVLEGSKAPELHTHFNTMAHHKGVPTDVLLKLFGCARYLTGAQQQQQGENLFITSNQLFAKFTTVMIDTFDDSIDNIRKEFAGNANEKEAKIEHIKVHLKELEQMRNLNNATEKAFIERNDAIFNYILSFKGEYRALALEFAIVTGKSSLAIVQEYEPPSLGEKIALVGTYVSDRIQGGANYFVHNVLGFGFPQ